MRFIKHTSEIKGRQLKKLRMVIEVHSLCLERVERAMISLLCGQPALGEVIEDIKEVIPANEGFVILHKKPGQVIARKDDVGGHCHVQIGNAVADDHGLLKMVGGHDLGLGDQFGLVLIFRK